MFKKIITVAMLVLILTGCAKTITCDICGQQKKGKTYEQEVFGVKVEMDICNDCKKGMEDLAGLFN